jgi:hypothetical protein
VLTEEKLDDTGASSNPQTVEKLKENIHREILNVAAGNLQKINQNFFRRCEECLRVEGQHFAHHL